MSQKSLAWTIGLRYTRSKRRNQFVSFISLASVIGIALGVAVLITILSVFNGFDSEIHKTFFAVVPEVTVASNANLSKEWGSLEKIVRENSQVTADAPFVNGNAVISLDNVTKGIQVNGIVPAKEQKISALSTKLIEGDYNSLVPGQFHMLIGSELAATLGVHVGDKVPIYMLQQPNLTPVGAIPRVRRFTVTGIFHVSNSVGFYNSAMAFIHLEDAAKLFPPGIGVSGLNIKIANIYDARAVQFALASSLPDIYQISTWMDSLGALFKAIAMEKTMMMIILMLIVAVAAFNLVSSLVMAVNEKQADIAILRTLGLRPRTIMAVFIIQGFILGMIGTILGLILGIILALNATNFVAWLQGVLHVQFVSENIYFVDFLPSKLLLSDLVTVTIAAIVMSLLATLYPAWQAFRIQPAEALRYE